MNPASPPGKVCVILTGALGDFILALPALQGIRAGLPSRRILLAGNPHWLPLARDCLWVDETLSVESLPLHEGFHPTDSGDKRLFRLLGEYEQVISWFGDREGIWERNLCRYLPGKTWVLPFHRHADFPGHVSDYYTHSLEEAGIVPSQSWDSPPWPVSRRWAPVCRTDRYRNPLELPPEAGLCLHPGSGSAGKNWPAEQFLRVAETVRNVWGIPVWILLGPAEADQEPFWSGEGRTLGFPAYKGLSLPEVFRLLSESALYLGNDSGITHLAASIGVPTVALFGPTDPLRWAPRGPRVRWLHHPGTDRLAGDGSAPPGGTRHLPPAMRPAEVLEILETLLEEEPGIRCFRGRRNPTRERFPV
jgi:heptosyltransferase III